MQPSEAAVTQSANASVIRPESANWLHWLTLLLLFVAGIVARSVCLACKPFWFDECFSVEVARIDWRNFLHLLWWREANMSLYYLLLRIWLHFGQSPFFIRSLSVGIAAATLPAIYWLARLLYDRRVALHRSGSFHLQCLRCSLCPGSPQLCALRLAGDSLLMLLDCMAPPPFTPHLDRIRSKQCPSCVCTLLCPPIDRGALAGTAGGATTEPSERKSVLPNLL